MVGGYENLVQLPTMGMFDNSMLKADIAAAREIYNLAREDYNNYMKEYGDFYSPISSDNDAFYNLTLGKANELINRFGPDIMRNSSGRAEIENMIRTAPVAELNKMRQRAGLAKEYIKNRAKLQLAGLWNPEFERYRLGGKSLEEWNPSVDGDWTWDSPSEFRNLNLIASPWFDKLKDSFIETDNQGRDWYGVTLKDMLGSIASNLGGFLSTDLGKFYYQQAQNELMNKGVDNPSHNLIVAQLSKDIIDSNGEVMHRNYEYNKEYLLNQQFGRDIYKIKLLNQLGTARDAAKAAAQERLLKLKSSLSGTSGKSGSKSGGTGGDEYVESWHQMARTAANIVGQTSYGVQFNVSNEGDFDPEQMSTLLPRAQAEIADKFYGTPNNPITVDAKKYADKVSQMSTSLLTGAPMPKVFGLDTSVALNMSPNLKITLQPSYSRKQFNNNNIDELLSFALRTPVQLGDRLYPSDKKYVDIKDDPKYADDIRQANYKFMSALSMDYDPVKFGHWIGGVGYEDKDKEGGITMTHKDRFTVRDHDVSRFFTLDDIALRASGVSNESYSGFQAQAMAKSREIQKDIEKNAGKYTFQLSNTSKPIVGLVGPDGAYHMYAWVTVKNESGLDVTDGECQIMYDLGIDSYPTPGYNNTGDNLARLGQFNNMYMDPQQNGDVRLGADMRAGKYLNLKKPSVTYDAAYPFVGVSPDDADYDAIMNMFNYE